MVTAEQLRAEIVELAKEWAKSVHRRCSYSGAGATTRALVDAVDKLEELEDVALSERGRDR